MALAQTRDQPRSRRALLAGALGGLGAWAAGAAARVDPVAAAPGDALRIGRTNHAGGTSTELRSQDSTPTFRAVQSGRGAALRAEATSGRAVMATAGSAGTGVWAFSRNHIGVRGRTEGRGSAALLGETLDGTGVYGASTNGVGIHGVAGQTGWAGMFNSRVRIHQYVEIDGQAVFDVPPPTHSSRARVFVRVNQGTQRHELCVQFPEGEPQVIATEP
jgi:hypothetical protein